MSKKSQPEHLLCARWQYKHVKDKKGKGVILDSFCRLSGFERKYAIKLLGGARGASTGEAKGRGRGGSTSRYGSTEIAVLKTVWLQSEQPCGKRLKALLPFWVPSWERHHGALETGCRQRLLSLSASHMDRLLAPFKVSGGVRRPDLVNAVRSQIPLRTGPWQTSGPGWLEGDTVAHCGGSMSGGFLWSVVLTDIWSGWTEVRVTWNRSDYVTHERLEQIEGVLPFSVLGFDSDNGGEFINGTVLRYFRRRKHPVEVTRSRPYHKNDNAHVEQKNRTHVRQFLGHERLGQKELVAPLNALVEKWSLWNNLFCPTLKLLKKERVGTRLKKVHEKHAFTPCQRLLESPSVSQTAKERLREQLLEHDPMDMKASIEQELRAFWSLRQSREFPPAEALEVAAEDEIEVQKNTKPKHAKKKKNFKDKEVDIPNGDPKQNETGDGAPVW
jgi:hypothetical protein